MPLISVILSTLNDEAYIQQAVDSILHQTINDFELIIINDGSTDRTRNILDQCNDPRIIRIDHDIPQTLPISLNEGLAIAQGEFIARMDGDDISHPTRFKKQIDYFSKNPEVSILGTQTKTFNVRSRQILKKIYPTTHSMILWYLFFGNALVHPTIMMRQQVLNLRQPLYNPEFTYSQDFELWHYILDKVIFANLEDELLTRRIHRKSSTLTKPIEWRTKNRKPALDSIFHLTGDRIDLPVLQQAMHHNIVGHFFSEEQAKDSIMLMSNLYHALLSKELIYEHEKDLVVLDMIERVMLLSHRSPSLTASIIRSSNYIIESIIPKRIQNIWRRYIKREA